jgi:ArsR family transcriptional regulator
MSPGLANSLVFTSPRGADDALIRAFKSLSDEARVRILYILSLGDFSVNEIVEILSMGQSSVSRHLKILTEAGFLNFRREGSWVYYSLRRDDFKAAIELTDIILKYKNDLPFREVDQRNSISILKKRELRSRKFFDDLGQSWEKVQEEVLEPRIYRDRVVQSLPAHSAMVLDLGCGPGGLIPYLLTKADQVVGLDSSARMVEVAKQEFIGNSRVRIEEAHLENLPIGDGEADSVVASMVLHHLSHPPKVIQEINRVLRIGGTFSLVDLSKHNQEFMREKYADLWMGFDTDLMESWLVSHGFEILEEEEIPTNSVFKILFIKAKKKEDINVRN